MVFAATLLASLLLAASAKPLERRMLIHETRDEVPRGFVQSGSAPLTKDLTLRIAMTPNNIAGLEAALYAVSDPASDLYGQHLTLDEVNEFVKPTDETLQTVNDWLAENNIKSTVVTPAGDQVQIVIPVSQANELLSAEFSVFTHVESGSTSVRTLQYHLPAELIGHVDFVHPTVSFTRPLSVKPQFTAVKKRAPVEDAVAPVSDAVPSSCATRITPACLQALYNIPTTPATLQSNILGVAGFIDQYANLADLEQFLGLFRPDMNSSTAFTVQSVDGGVNLQTPGDAGFEANLDIQYTVGLATGVPVAFISVGDYNSDGAMGFLDIITAISQEPSGTRPTVLSTSYAFDETDFTLPVANTLCNAYMALGALGTSLIFGSGDGGVAGVEPQACTNFVPVMPSGCPFVTSVGATQRIPETAAAFSAGGFSNYFGIPSYQAADVESYLSGLGSTNEGKFNASGRGIPDVAAQGAGFEILLDGDIIALGGASCSTPTFASVIALLNDELITAGKPALGFLNPFLYSAAGRAALNDITTGINPGCQTDGFSATTGWDPITGLGTPNYALLRTAVGLD